MWARFAQCAIFISHFLRHNTQCDVLHSCSPYSGLVVGLGSCDYDTCGGTARVEYICAVVYRFILDFNGQNVKFFLHKNNANSILISDSATSVEFKMIETHFMHSFSECSSICANARATRTQNVTQSNNLIDRLRTRITKENVNLLPFFSCVVLGKLHTTCTDFI